jgi:UDP-GlcNAc:undecaprenyl-phosphate GlcNAc-1-phosphate transferase
MKNIFASINLPKFNPRSFFQKAKFTNGIQWVYLINAVIIAAGYLYLFNSIGQLPDKVPFFFSLPWGEAQLAPSYYLWWLAHLATFILVFNAVFSFIELNNSNFTLSRYYSYISVTCGFLLISYLTRIITLVAYYPVIFPDWVKIIAMPLLAAVIVTSIATPFVIRFAKKYGYMDDPLRHKHPGMLLKRPTPRAGGLAYFIGLLIPAMFFLPILESQKLIGVFIAAAICVLMGLRDDKKDIHPIVRIVGQIVVIFIAVLSGIILIYVPNPFGTPLNLDYFRYAFEFLGTHTVYYYSALAAAVWIGVTMNFMSFANGTDGVYAGLVTISSLVISILMFQSLELDPGIAIFAKLAAISAGAGLGMAFFTWPPQKLLWGFGATSAGLVIACLSILGSTKVAVMLIVLIIPFLDGIFAVMRRLRRGQMPFWGDREHLHHKLLEGLGWSKQQVAIFYWVTTAIFGVIAIATSGQARAVALATMCLIFIAGIALVNFVKKPKL